MTLVRSQCGVSRYTHNAGLLRRGEDRCGDACCPAACVRRRQKTEGSDDIRQQKRIR